MKKRLFSAALALTCWLSSNAQADPQTIKDIETVCNYYLEGGSNGDSVLFSKAFSPTGQMQYMRNDTLVIVSLKDFMARTRNTGVKQNRTTKIENVQVFGNAATAKALNLTIPQDLLLDAELIEGAR